MLCENCTHWMDKLFFTYVFLIHIDKYIQQNELRGIMCTKRQDQSLIRCYFCYWQKCLFNLFHPNLKA